MAKITEAAMRDAREGLDTGDAGAREKATRALRFWAMERTEENIELYLALKVSVQRQGCIGGVQKHMMGTWKAKTEASAFAVRKLIVQERANAPWLAQSPAIMKNLVDFDSVVTQLPIELDRHAVWLFDPNAREVARLENITMGPGAFEIELKVGNRKTNKSVGSVPMAMADGSEKPAPTTLAIQSPSIPVVAQTHTSLLRRTSDPDPDDWASAERRAKGVVEAFKELMLYSPDPNDAEFGEYWVGHARRMIEQTDASEQLPEHVPAFLNLVVKLLLDTDCYPALPKFTAHFTAIVAKRPELETLLMKALIRIGDFDLALPVAVDLSFLDVKLKPKERLAFSVLMKSFQKACRQARYEKAKKGVDMSPESRLQILDELINSGLSKTPGESDRVAEMLIMKTILGPGPHEDKLVYLLEDPGRLSVLKDWLPGDGRTLFGPFTQKSGTFAGFTSTRFRTAAKVLIQSDRAVKAITHPLAQLLLAEWQSVNKSMAEWTLTDTAMGAPWIPPFVEEAFVELAVVKLGIEGHQGKDHSEIEVLPSELFRALCKVADKMYKKWGSALNAPALAKLQEQVQRENDAIKAEQARQAEQVRQTKQVPETKQVVVPPIEDAQVEKLNKDGENAVGAQGGLTHNDMSVGQKIIVIAGQHKELYNDREAELITVNPASVWCRMLEGPKKNEQLKRNYKQFRLPSPAKQATIAPAGTASKPDKASASKSNTAAQAGDEDEAAAKKLKGASRAAALFGDNNDVADM